MTLLAAVLGILALCAAGLVLFTWRTARAVEKALPAQGLFLAVDGARLHYLDEGQGPAIVMIHGLGGQIAHFTYALADRLKGDFRVVLIDRPGSGYSEKPEGASARLRAQGDVIAKAIAALKLEKPLVVGHSLGGAIALAVALDHPDQVSGLALIAPFTRPIDQPPAAFEMLRIESDLKRRLIAWTLAIPFSIYYRDRVLGAVFTPDPVPDDFPVKARGLLGLRPRAFEAASLDMVSANKDLWGMVKRYGDLTMPVGILYGAQDGVLDPRLHALSLEGELPALEIELTDGGHMLPISAPDRCAAFIRRVWQRTAASGTAGTSAKAL